MTKQLQEYHFEIEIHAQHSMHTVQTIRGALNGAGIGLGPSQTAMPPALRSRFFVTSTRNSTRSWCGSMASPALQQQPIRMLRLPFWPQNKLQSQNGQETNSFAREKDRN